MPDIKRSDQISSFQESPAIADKHA